LSVFMPSRSGIQELVSVTVCDCWWSSIGSRWPGVESYSPWQDKNQSVNRSA
jgi:hypothetical protein